VPDIDGEFEFPVFPGGEVNDLLAIHENRYSSAGQRFSVFGSGPEKAHISLRTGSDAKRKEDEDREQLSEIHKSGVVGMN
jgi:hypothetical protein